MSSFPNYTPVVCSFLTNSACTYVFVFSLFGSKKLPAVSSVPFAGGYTINFSFGSSLTINSSSLFLHNSYSYSSLLFRFSLHVFHTTKATQSNMITTIGMNIPRSNIVFPLSYSKLRILYPLMQITDIYKYFIYSKEEALNIIKMSLQAIVAS